MQGEKEVWERERERKIPPYDISESLYWMHGYELNDIGDLFAFEIENQIHTAFIEREKKHASGYKVCSISFPVL